MMAVVVFVGHVTRAERSVPTDCVSLTVSPAVTAFSVGTMAAEVVAGPVRVHWYAMAGSAGRLVSRNVPTKAAVMMDAAGAVGHVWRVRAVAPEVVCLGAYQTA